MIEEKKFSIEMRKDMTCKAGAKILTATASYGPEDILQSKLILGKEKKQGKWCCYLDEEKNENLVAKVTAIKDGDTELDDMDISVLREMTHNIVLKGKQENVMRGELVLLKDETSANKSSKKDTNDEVLRLVQEKAQEGIDTEDALMERIQYMLENGVDDFLILRTVRDWRRHKKSCHMPSTKYVDPYLQESKRMKIEGLVAEGLRSSADRVAVILEGEKSVGKNVFAETIAWLRCEPQYLITFSRQMSPSAIYGEKTTDNSAAEALQDFDPVLLVKKAEIDERIRFGMNLMVRTGLEANAAMEQIMRTLTDEDRKVLEAVADFEKKKAQSQSVNIVIDSSELYDWLIDGGQMVFNEMNMAEANFFASFTNQLLDGTGFLFIPGRGEVPINPDCVLFGTQNAEYEGVEQQNEATMSRFGCLYFKQPESIKPQLIAAVTSILKRDGFKKTKLPAKYFNAAENFYKQCRQAVKKDTVSNAVLNIRGFVRALSAVAKSDGHASLRRQVEIHVINTIPIDERPGVLAILESIIDC